MPDKPPLTHAQLKQLGAEKAMQAKVRGSQYPTPAQLKVADEYVGIFQLICGTTSTGQEFYAYVSFRFSTYEEFMTKSINGERVDLEKYAKVIKKGHGLQPSEDVKRFMEETYGFDHNFMQNLANEVEKIRQQKKK